MKVKISYSVDLENVPSKIGDVLSESIEQYSQLEKKHKLCLEMLASHVGLPRTQMAIELIHEIRKTLTEMDQSLADSQAVLSGYAAYKTKEQAEGLEADFANTAGYDDAAKRETGNAQDANEG